MTEPVRARRVAMIAGLLVAACVFGTLLIRPLPDLVLAGLGGPSGAFARSGGIRVHYRPAPGAQATFERYLGSRANVRRDGELFVLELPGLAEDRLPDVRELLVGGGLQMKEVVEGTHAAQIADLIGLPVPPRSDPRAEAEVWVEIDSWRSEDSDTVRSSMYLQATRGEALTRALDAAKARGFALPADREIAFEWFEPSPGAEDPRPQWRSYELASPVLVDGTMIANATGAYDPYTNRPVVVLDLTRAGAQTFCAVTTRIRGGKLAVLSGGRVRSAPIVNGAICGGQVTITLGGNDPRQQERERDALVAVLAQGALPAGGTIERATWMPAPDVSRQTWAGRLLLAALAGVAGALLVGLALRFARPVRAPVPAAVAGAFPWQRLLVTLLAPAAWILGTKVTLPGINTVELAYVTDGRAGIDVSVFALGVAPIVLAFLLVEVVALAVPRLRWRRHDPLGRVRLGQAVAVVAIPVAMAQAYFVAVYLESLGRGLIVADPGARFELLTMGSLVGGTLLLAVLAGVIREHGLGDGYFVLIVSSLVIEGVRPYLAEAAVPVGRGTVLGAVAIAAIAAATVAILRARIRGGARAPMLRVPTSGIAPLTETTALLALLATVSAFGLGEALDDTVRRVSALPSRTWVMFALAIASVPAWAWVFARPRVVEEVARRAGLERPSRAAWLRAAVISGTFLIGVLAIGTLAALADAEAAVLAAPLAIIYATAVVLDVIADARAHHARLVPAGVLHQIQHAGVVEHVLAEAGIPCHLHASHVRTLLAFFGPFAPVIVLVPAAHGEAARTKLDEILRVPRATIPAARVEPAT